MIELDNLSIKEQFDLLTTLEKYDYNYSGRKIDSFFATEENRNQYKKTLEFFKQGAIYSQRLLMAANRTGKTVAGAYELTCHATGIYPDWWEGKRFDKPITAWVVGDRSKTVRDILQLELLGEYDHMGTGMIPRTTIDKHNKAMGLGDSIDVIDIKHSSGGRSVIQFKTYEQGRKAFEGTAKDIIWLDEEGPEEIYLECLYRTASTNGILFITFTPLWGLTQLVNNFVKAPPESSKSVVNMTWDDVPHLTDKIKTELLASTPPFMRDARTKGIPQLGAGAIYPVPESDFVIPPIEIPKYWKRLFALDVGWGNTAAAWLAIDPETDIYYIYSDYKKGQEQPFVHAQAIKSRGSWIPGVVDPASMGSGQDDGQKIKEQYEEAGLKLDLANNAVEAGIYAVWERLSTGKLKIFNSCVGLLEEFRMYHRDEKGHIVKKHDHIMDAMRYAVMTSSKAQIEIASIVNTSNFYNVSTYNRVGL